MWSDFILKWSEVSYSEVLGDKSVMYISVTLHWGTLFYVSISFGYILYCVCFNFYYGCFSLFCNVWVFW